MNKFLNLYKNKKVLITGHTGFKGSWLSNWLLDVGANVIGVSLPQTNTDHIFNKSKISKYIKSYYQDINNADMIKGIITSEKPDFIFHLAAQALVGDSYDNPKNTWNTNLIGTLNVIDSLRYLKNKCNVVLITSDKCYYNREWLWGYKETDTLGGDDPYSASKAATELLIHSHIKSFYNNSKFIRISSARAGNVIGGGDWSQNRIIPDCFKSWINKKPVKIRNFNSTRPWQFVLEPLYGYLKLGYYLNKSKIKYHGESFNFGPDSNSEHTVLEVLNEIKKQFPQACWKSINKKTIKESTLLKLNCDKSLNLLNWKCALTFQETIKYTIYWYNNFLISPNKIDKITISQIKDYTKKINENEL